MHKRTGIKRTNDPTISSKNIRNLQNYWKDISYQNIDEIGNIGCQTLCKINNNQQNAKNNNLPFGGIHTILSGDFFQLRCIYDTPLYTPSQFENKEDFKKKFNSNIKQKQITADYGRFLWLQITHCVILTKPMRQINDIQFADILSRIRYGNGTDEDYELLKTRIYGNPNYIRNLNNINEKIIYPRNNIKNLTNELLAKNFAKKHKKLICFNFAKDTWNNKGHSALFDEYVKLKLIQIEENKTDKLIYKLPLIVGCKYILTKNVCTELGLSNNNEVVLENIILSNDLNIQNLEENEIIYLLVSKPSNTINNISYFPGLEPNLYPIKLSSVTFRLELGKKYGQRMNIRRKQFPLNLCFAVSCHFAQGSTITNGLLDLTNPPDGKMDNRLPYTGFTRFVSLESLTIMDNFEKTLIQTPPDANLINEEIRYKKLANKTMLDYYSNKQEFKNIKQHLSIETYIASKGMELFKIDPIIKTTKTQKKNSYNKKNIIYKENQEDINMNNVQELSLTIDELKSGAYLTDIEITAFLNLLRLNFPLIHGLENPSMFVFNNFESNNITDQFVRIVHCREKYREDHWVCITGRTIKNGENFKLYDSLGQYRECIQPYLGNQIKKFVKSNSKNVSILMPNLKSQTNSLCGFYACAFATAYCYQFNIDLIEFDEDKLVNHWINCIQTKNLSMFPFTIRILKDINYKTFIF